MRMPCTSSTNRSARTRTHTAPLRACGHQGQRYSRDGPTHARAATVDRIDVRTPTYHPDPPTRTRDHPR